MFATLLDPRFKATLLEEAKTEFATQTLFKICEFATLQRSQECTQSITSDEHNEQQPELQPMDIDDNTEHQISISSSKERKGFSVWDSYKIAMK